MTPPCAKLDTNIRFWSSNAALSSPPIPVTTSVRFPEARSMRVISPAGPVESTTSVPARSKRTATGEPTSAASSGTPPSGAIRQTWPVRMCG